MVSKMDEYLVHQTEKPLSQVASDHLDWQDRYYFNMHDKNGEFAALTGLGAFPNRNNMQAFMFVNYQGQHYAYFNVRPLAEDRETMQVGSLSCSVLEPLKAWKLEVADESNGISGSLTFRARCPLYVFDAIRWDKDDYTVVHQRHYTQAGRYEGEFRIGDKVFTDVVGIRDRSWGIRDLRSVPMWIWIAAQFREFCISAWLWETPDGEVIHQDGAVTYENGNIRPIRRIEHELQLNPGTKRPKSARYRLTTADGETLQLGASEISSIFLFPPMTRWSDSDAEALAKADAVSFGFDQHTRYELNGETGFGIVEYMMTGGSKRYGVPPTRLEG